jgi:hypothetical protein
MERSRWSARLLGQRGSLVTGVAAVCRRSAAPSRALAQGSPRCKDGLVRGPWCKTSVCRNSGWCSFAFSSKSRVSGVSCHRAGRSRDRAGCWAVSAERACAPAWAAVGRWAVWCQLAVSVSKAFSDLVFKRKLVKLIYPVVGVQKW